MNIETVKERRNLLADAIRNGLLDPAWNDTLTRIDEIIRRAPFTQAEVIGLAALEAALALDGGLRDSRDYWRREVDKAATP